jgi:hypothetical protein
VAPLTCRACGRDLGASPLRTVRALGLCANDLARTPLGSAAYQAYETELTRPASRRLPGLLARAQRTGAVPAAPPGPVLVGLRCGRCHADMAPYLMSAYWETHSGVCVCGGRIAPVYVPEAAPEGATDA